MTPKEKARELINKFWNEATYENEEHKPNYTSKQCALICVDEILEVTPMYKGLLNHKWIYWNNVKQEIEKL